MKYILRQRLWSFADRFNITDMSGVPQFYVEGKFLSIGRKLRLYAMNGEELFYIEQVILRLLSEYNIYQAQGIVANVKREFSILKPRFRIDSIYGDFELEGNFLALDFLIRKEGRTVCTVTKKFLSFSDTYTADIEEQEDQAFFLALVIVIDQVIHSNKGGGNAGSS